MMAHETHAIRPAHVVDISHYCWRKRLWSYAIALVAICLICTLGILSFGNSQWHIWIYRFQAEIFPGHEHEFIPPPPKYTGPWQVYFRDGLIGGFSGGTVTLIYEDGFLTRGSGIDADGNMNSMHFDSPRPASPTPKTIPAYSHPTLKVSPKPPQQKPLR